MKQAYASLTISLQWSANEDTSIKDFKDMIDKEIDEIICKIADSTGLIVDTIELEVNE